MKIKFFRKVVLTYIFISAVSYLCTANSPAGNDEKLPYQNFALPIEQRVNDLLSRMTLEEKVGQLNMPCVYKSELGKDIAEKIVVCKKLTEGLFEKRLGPIGGFFVFANDGLVGLNPGQQADSLNMLQKIAIDKTRLKIPLLITEEGTHGFMASGATIFPEGLAIGSTWNMELVYKIYSVVAKEARAVGSHQLHTLVIEPNRDPRLGRNQEGYSEDTYLCGELAKTIVRAVQGENISAEGKLIAGLGHFPGQSEPVKGLERGAMEISERKLREVFLPPWVEGIKKSGALGVMATYATIDGVNTHASKKLLSKILREELGFEGLVMSEGGGLNTSVWAHVAESKKKAGELAIKAGVDVGISFEPAYKEYMLENVEEGKVSIELIDRSVRRILKIKFMLGLFENPYVDSEHAEEIVHNKEHIELALESAHEGIVLLKNENNLLPLNKKVKSIAVIGPNADNERNQLGDYIADKVTQNIVTVLDGIKRKVSSDTKIEYVKGCKVLLTDFNEIEKARKAAKKADVAIVVVGENERYAMDGDKRVGTNGEHMDVADLDLTGFQEELIKAVYSTGTPTVVVLINGRPLSIRWTAEHVPAIIEAWIPGEKGGDAIADILFGDYNPNGKLAISIPRHVGQLPVYYNLMKDSKKELERGYVNMSKDPLYEFGFGLSYTKFEYSNLQITPMLIGTGGEVNIVVDVRNVGKY
ncbi:MAG: glycoside hydrolase family 3 C-terminal domain-containing protein, partial [Bacteroidales bacterium]|nr:glycoside hydrolase family 3 C-terminal domain-containing protein [Bacteroidales bacterium]